MLKQCVRVRGLWCTEVKLWFGLRAGVAGPGIVWAHEGRHCRRVPLSAHVRESCDLASPPEWALCFCGPWLCLGLSLISTPYLFSRSRVTCLRSWSPFFHTTNALWQQPPPPSKAFSSLQECLISQVCLQLKSLFSPCPFLPAYCVFPLHFLFLNSIFSLRAAQQIHGNNQTLDSHWHALLCLNLDQDLGMF